MCIVKLEAIILEKNHKNVKLRRDKCSNVSCAFLNLQYASMWDQKVLDYYLVLDCNLVLDSYLVLGKY